MGGACYCAAGGRTDEGGGDVDGLELDVASNDEGLGRGSTGGRMRDWGGCRCCEDALLSLRAAGLGAPAWNGELGGSDAIVVVVFFAVC
jgi:hypothetical protein